MTDDNDAVNSSSLGIQFDNKDDVKVYVEEYNKKNFTNFVIESINSLWCFIASMVFTGTQNLRVLESINTTTILPVQQE